MNLGMNLAADKIEMDHDGIREAFGRFAERAHRSRSMDICDGLERHAQMEDELVHPMLGMVDADRAAASEAAHAEIDDLIAEVRAASARSELRTLVARLRDRFDQHVVQEKADLTAMADALGVSEMNQLGFRIGDWLRSWEREGDDLDELLEMTREELYEKARAADVSGRSTMNKRELADALASN